MGSLPSPIMPSFHSTCNVTWCFQNTLDMLQVLSTVTDLHSSTGRQAWLPAHSGTPYIHTASTSAAPDFGEAEAALGAQLLQSGHVGHMGAVANKGW